MYSIASAFMVVTILFTLFSTMFLSAVSSAGRDESTDITDTAPPVSTDENSLKELRILGNQKQSEEPKLSHVCVK